MDLQEVREKAREVLKGICRVCVVCDGRNCPTGVPGIGGAGTGEGFRRNIASLARWKLNLRVLHPRKIQDTTFELFGHKLSFPILGGAIAGAKVNFGGRLDEREIARALVLGAKAAGTVALTGDGPDPEVFAAGLAAIREADGWGIPVIKPRSNKEIIKRIREAEKTGALAVAIDVDAAGLFNMTRVGQVVEPKTAEDIIEIARSTSLPLILKGIMTVADAKVALASGAVGIVVSNHGGRALDHTLGTADVLPGIAAAVKGRLMVLVDGGIRSGVDVLKMLALGADAVLVGRPLFIAACGGGPQGVKMQLEALAQELTVAMRLTGCGALQDISSEVICNVM
ncbi:FMN-dependent dehydrogenase, includes L-lactate dehydrogenase and type II isopentenyl diphosphate isomerase [Thermanaeromonas toyohensis ToBE]|uniref:L-lactate oxidase n=1 Tax=Thermanaeromonas toyohensis ToBE TaxID=698762 RepID=A0A1W1V9T6_9FIRM|nr:alpha-hydroxy-acid oxidizing protein [Thermanaeromonas toyohensis]SMB90217.1 FMN-dependent dehydrogenase, includes L-lactate dehydrogenase and type II isopentenyl diphosphate isomerase [Thermanaeromonas toyohensis ToBE]